MPQGQERATGHRGEDISTLDKRIIEQLQRDGRRPFTAIAADLGISEAAVRARANRLIERGIVQIVGVTDPLRLGFGQMAMIGVHCHADKAWAAAEAIAAFPEVHYLVITTGRFDMVVEVVCEDNEALLRFLTEKLGRVDGVRDSETFVYLRLMKQAFTWGAR
jgi:Lrp/AsnC family transcriptional regulator for asnA, asnC and gidA